LYTSFAVIQRSSIVIKYVHLKYSYSVVIHSPITLVINYSILEDHVWQAPGLYEEYCHAPGSSTEAAKSLVSNTHRDRLALTGESAEAKTVRASLEAVSLAIDLVASISSANGAGNEAGLEVEVAEAVAAGRSSLAELVDDGASGDVRGVSGGVAQGAVGADVDLLATGHDDAERQSTLAASEDGGVAGRAAARRKVVGAVRGGCASTEVELSVASGQGGKMDGRCATSGDDTKVARVRSRSAGWLWGTVGGGSRRRDMALSCGEGTSDKTCESESVFHSEGCSECVA
jgi:hypothetical protein